MVVAERLSLRKKLSMQMDLPLCFVHTPVKVFDPVNAQFGRLLALPVLLPSFFKEMYIDNPRPGVAYVDGGLGHNNPSQVALDEAERIWQTSKNFCLVSIGTGRQRAVKITGTSKPDDDIDIQRSLFQHMKSFVPHIVSLVPGWKTVNNFPPGVLALIKMANVHQEKFPWQ